MTSSQTRKITNVDVVVLGAGISGLMAARELVAAGLKVVVLEKGRGVGGRVATRRFDGAVFDHGAQFMTARDPRFEAVLSEAQSSGQTAEWCRGFHGLPDGHPRWRGHPGMSAFAKHLARNLDIRLETQVSLVRLSPGQCHLETVEGEVFIAPSVILTAPVPQSLALLDKGGVILPPSLRDRLGRIAYERCLAVMAVLETNSLLSPPGAMSPVNGSIAWIADNQLKGISTEPAVTLHATDAFSREHWDRDRTETGNLLLTAAAPWLGCGVKSFQVHGWRYSKPLHIDPEPCALLHSHPTLLMAGDAFAGPRVEGSALSGWAAAGILLAQKQ